MPQHSTTLIIEIIEKYSDQFVQCQKKYEVREEVVVAAMEEEVDVDVDVDKVEVEKEVEENQLTTDLVKMNQTGNVWGRDRRGMSNTAKIEEKSRRVNLKA